MEQNPVDLSGMSPAAAKEYILAFAASLKLSEKQALELEQELGKWKSRAELARSACRPDLAEEAEKGLARANDKKQRLNAEIAGLRSQIEEMRRKLPLLAARERSVDPDLLEQELLIAAGRLPGEETEAANERLFRDLEKEAAAGAALSELKAKMEGTG
ncbi:MAG: chromosome partitioning protein [Treponema sp.]|jgi:phage shock protein A|nr:chromosome partitioning protein [Treponema sp.]